MDKFSELKAAALAATQGAWDRGWDNDTGPSDDYFVEWQTAGPARFYEDNSENDADFASKATPETILAILAELEAKDKRIAEIEVSHKKLRETLAAVHNTITGGGAYTSLAGILTAVKRAYLESSDASARTFTVEGDE